MVDVVELDQLKWKVLSEVGNLVHGSSILRLDDHAHLILRQLALSTVLNRSLHLFLCRDERSVKQLLTVGLR